MEHEFPEQKTQKEFVEQEAQTDAVKIGKAKREILELKKTTLEVNSSAVTKSGDGRQFKTFIKDQNGELSEYYPGMEVPEGCKLVKKHIKSTKHADEKEESSLKSGLITTTFLTKQEGRDASTPLNNATLQ